MQFGLFEGEGRGHPSSQSRLMAQHHNGTYDARSTSRTAMAAGGGDDVEWEEPYD